MWVRLTCLLRRRHHYRLRMSEGRMYMQCLDCGSRSQGWEMGPKARPLIPRRDRTPSFRLLLDDVPLEPVPDSTLDSVGVPPRPADELRFQLDS